MNSTLQRHCAKFIYIVPEGLRELMSDISREVIRSQPEQIYVFIADYLDALLITRENARVAARLVETICEIAESSVEILVKVGLTRAEADDVCNIIQAAFRAHLERKKLVRKTTEVEPEEEIVDEKEEITNEILKEISVPRDHVNEIVKIIQHAWKKFKERKEREKKLLFGMVDWRIAARSAITLYRKTGVTRYEANRAATLIKAAYKGYYTRRIMKRLLQKGLETELFDFQREIPAVEEETYESMEGLDDVFIEGMPDNASVLTAESKEKNIPPELPTGEDIYPEDVGYEEEPLSMLDQEPIQHSTILDEYPSNFEEEFSTQPVTTEENDSIPSNQFDELEKQNIVALPEDEEEEEEELGANPEDAPNE